MKKVTMLIIFFSLFSFLQAQVEIQDRSGLVSSKAFSKKITTDFNYLILGENSPQQGISATVNDKKSNIKINGLLMAKENTIISLEADLTASNGVYFFDQSNGSEQGKITLNFYRPIKRYSKYTSLSPLSRVTLKMQILELISQTKADYEGLRKLMEKIKAEDESQKKVILYEEDKDKDKGITQLKAISKAYLNDQHIDAYDKIDSVEFTFDNKPYHYKDPNTEMVKKDNFALIKPISPNKKSEVKISYEKNLKVAKLLAAYKAKQDFIVKKLQDSINSLELEKVDANWTSNHVVFWGMSPFYERQSFKRFTYNSNQTFKDMFETERGDVFGITGSINYSYEKRKKNKNIYQPKSFLLRLSGTLSRTSNITSFKNSTIDATGTIGNDVNGNPITFTSNDNAFMGDGSYEYGFGNKFVLDAYYYPFTLPIGIFGIIGYDHISFSSASDLKNKELYPMRLGLFFSLTNKEKKKPLVTIQTFIDRTDLNLKTSGSEGDLRFGLGIGLPLNFN